MRITEVRVTPRGENRFLAYATITLEGCFVVRGLKVIAGENHRLFVAMPSRKKKDGSFQDIAHPITGAFRNELETAVLDEYNRVLRERAESPVAEEGP